jgi:hypothetical protein
MGPERKSMVMREEERRNTAYHESGHAVIAKLLPKADPVHKVTIMPRGYALGLTWQLPEHDALSGYKDKMLEEISILFGGRIAEEIFVGQMSTGASNDFSRATKLARSMVTRFGMSESMGVMVYEDSENEGFFGGATKTISEATQQKVDAEIRSHPRHAVRAGAPPARREPRQGRNDDQGPARVGNHRCRADQRHHGRPRAEAAEVGQLTKRTPPRRQRLGWRGTERHGTGLIVHASMNERIAGFQKRHPVGCSFIFSLSCSPISIMRQYLQCGRFGFDLAKRPLVMGILNVTPDSFSDGGRYQSLEFAFERAELMIKRGRRHHRHRRRVDPSRSPACPCEEELRRVMPAVYALRELGVALSIDTCKPEVMREAIIAGADMINDINGFRAPGAIEAVRDSDCGLCIMHMQGTPQDMQAQPHYEDVVARGDRLPARTGRRLAGGRHGARTHHDRSRIWLWQDCRA